MNMIKLIYSSFRVNCTSLPFSTIFTDAPLPWQIGFQDTASPGFTGISLLHNGIFFYMILISLAVFWVLGAIVKLFNSQKTNIVHKYWTHGTVIELVWTITPIY